jgi:hypothetical protein
MLEVSAQQEVRRLFEFREKWSLLWYAGVSNNGGSVTPGIYTAGLHSNERAAAVDTFFKS